MRRATARGKVGQQEGWQPEWSEGEWGGGDLEGQHISLREGGESSHGEGRCQTRRVLELKQDEKDPWMRP